jgi:hypothetical protein
MQKYINLQYVSIFMPLTVSATGHTNQFLVDFSVWVVYNDGGGGGDDNAKSCESAIVKHKFEGCSKVWYKQEQHAQMLTSGSVLTAVADRVQTPVLNSQKSAPGLQIHSRYPNLNGSKTGEPDIYTGENSDLTSTHLDKLIKSCLSKWPRKNVT